MRSQAPNARNVKDAILTALVYAGGILVCLILLFILAYIFFRGIPSITTELLTTESSYIHDTIGILPNILNT